MDILQMLQANGIHEIVNRLRWDDVDRPDLADYLESISRAAGVEQVVEGKERPMKLKEAIKTLVMVEESGSGEKELEITYESDVLEFSVDGQIMFSGDWSGNFLHIFRRAMELWGDYSR